jgi:hypothetical protein
MLKVKRLDREDLTSYLNCFIHGRKIPETSIGEPDDPVSNAPEPDFGAICKNPVFFPASPGNVLRL